MANSYTKIFLHLVFAVKNRESIIPPTHLREIHNYIAGSMSKREHHVIEIGGTSNHIHILFHYNPKELLSDLIRDIKSSSTYFIREKRFTPYHFNWQRGYGCFSVDSGKYEMVCEYIRNQEQHHNNFSIRGEMKRLLTRYGMDYDEEFIFEDV